MGECLIARGQTATKNVLDDIPVSGDYCSIVVLLQDSAGGPCENTKINCKDGTRWYNYTTNEAGMVLFKCNSGAANISANNWINGVYTFDQAAVSKDYDAPVGTKRLENLVFPKINNFSRLDSGWYNGWFRGTNRIKNLIVVGGGGGGGMGNASSGISMGCGGGGGGLSYATYVDINTNQNYSIYVGAGGHCSYGNSYGNTGETSMAFGISANGGTGGGGVNAGWTTKQSNYGIGGLAMCNGGNGSGHVNFNANDGENGAGGGGGAARFQDPIYKTCYGGNNGGGYGCINNENGFFFNGTAGLRGSGGGGGGTGGANGGLYPNPKGSGGSGRVTFDM